MINCGKIPSLDLNFTKENHLYLRMKLHLVVPVVERLLGADGLIKTTPRQLADLQ